jgi:hypothetical protein
MRNTEAQIRDPAFCLTRTLKLTHKKLTGELLARYGMQATKGKNESGREAVG